MGNNNNRGGAIVGDVAKSKSAIEAAKPETAENHASEADLIAKLFSHPNFAEALKTALATRNFATLDDVAKAFADDEAKRQDAGPVDQNGGAELLLSDATFLSSLENVTGEKLRHLAEGDEIVQSILSNVVFVSGVENIAEAKLRDLAESGEIVSLYEISKVVADEKAAEEAAEHVREESAALEGIENKKKKQEKVTAAAAAKASAMRISEAATGYARVLELGGAEASAKAELRKTGGFIVLADGSSLMPWQAPVPVAMRELEPRGERVIYTGEISTEPAQDPGNATEAWLVGEHAALRCEIPGGAMIGGGRSVLLAARSLIF